MRAYITSLSARRAWIEIASGTLSDTSDVTSLSARRAWIEIENAIRVANDRSVALRKESVDRNCHLLNIPAGKSSSLSARRAWIEIFMRREMSLIRPSLSARRAWIEIPHAAYAGITLLASLSARRAWIEIFYRNLPWLTSLSLSARRAWIEILIFNFCRLHYKSLSARRAWIEIHNRI